MTLSFADPLLELPGLASGQLRSRTTGKPIGIFGEIKCALMLLISTHHLLMDRDVHAGAPEPAELNELQMQVYQGVLADLEAALARGGPDPRAAAQAVERLRSLDERLAAALS